MLKLIKALHVLGVVLFFGSILGHAIAGLAENVHDSAQTQRIARQIIDVATWYLTVPGLLLLTLTGITMVVMRKASLLKMRWTFLHVVIAALIVLNATFVLLPTGQAILAIIDGLAKGTGTGTGAGLRILEEREAMFGAINILLCLTAVFVGVIKPRLGGKAS